MNKKTIMFLICDHTCLMYFHSLLDTLSGTDHFEVVLIARERDLVRTLKKYFPGKELRVGYDPALLDSVKPDLVVCYQMWWWDIQPMLLTARSENIPVLMYEHGSIMHFCEQILKQHDDYVLYRGNLALCSHVACWGRRHVETAVSFGVLHEKLYLTGAVHYDYLYTEEFKNIDIYDALQIPRDKKIIFLCTAFTTQNRKHEERLTRVIAEVEEFIAGNPDYQLVIKAHPYEMRVHEKPVYEYRTNPVIIAGEYETCNWPGVKRVCVERVVKEAFTVVSLFSSFLLLPAILNVPAIFIVGTEDALNANIAHFFRDYYYSLRESTRFSDIVGKISHSPSPGGITDFSGLAKILNYDNDGRAIDRFISLMRDIIAAKESGARFYRPELEEYMECLRRYPFLPFPYINLIHYCKNEGDYEQEAFYVDEICHKFLDPSFLLRGLAEFYFKEKGDCKRSLEYLSRYMKYRELDEELQRLYDEALVNVSRRIEG